MNKLMRISIFSFIFSAIFLFADADIDFRNSEYNKCLAGCNIKSHVQMTSENTECVMKCNNAYIKKG